MILLASSSSLPTPLTPPTLISLSSPWTKEQMDQLIYHYQLQCFQKYGGSILNPIGTNPTYLPFYLHDHCPP